MRYTSIFFGTVWYGIFEGERGSGFDINHARSMSSVVGKTMSDMAKTSRVRGVDHVVVIRRIWPKRHAYAGLIRLR